ncbi:MAG: TolB-like translocation protein [Planctomycetota bacterium]|jgi:hypothetical protein
MLRRLCPLFVLASCASQPLPFGLDAPGAAPELFAPGIVSTEEAIELNGVISPDGREFFFTRVDPDGRFVMYRSRLVDDAWTEPVAVQAFRDDVGDTAVDMTYSADGNSLVFLGRAPGGIGDPPSLDLWRMQREGDGWSLAEVIPPPVSTRHGESYPCLVADGSLYFSSRRPGGLGDSDLWRAQRRADGSYEEPVNLGAPINTEYAEGDTWVSPEEDVLVVTSRRPGGHGRADLWISTREGDGTWSEPRNLGPTINTEGYEYCPMGTWDGRVFFFSRRIGDNWAEATGGMVYWVDAKVLAAR